jgi:Histidine kinase-like ATPase domain
MARVAQEGIHRPPGEQRPLSLTIPCKAEYLALCRLVVGALGSHEALDEEVIADLKVVVTEACNCFLTEAEGCFPPSVEQGQGKPGSEEEPSTSLRVDIYVSRGAWEIVVFDPDQRRRISPENVCDPLSGGGLGLTIIQALVDSMEQTDSDAEGSVIRLVKRTAPAVSDSD